MVPKDLAVYAMIAVGAGALLFTRKKKAPLAESVPEAAEDEAPAEQGPETPVKPKRRKASDVNKEKRETARRLAPQMRDRIQIRKLINKADHADKHIFIDAVAHDKYGIFYTRKGDLLAVIRVDGISKDGLSKGNLDQNCEKLARAFAKLGNKGVPLTIHSVMDTSMSIMDPIPTDWHNSFLREVEEERNKFLAGRVAWKTESFFVLEWRGEFSRGGAVTIGDAWQAFRTWVRAKMNKERKLANKNWYTMTALFSSDKQIFRIFSEDIEKEITRFNTVIEEVMDTLTSEGNGIGAFEEMDSVVPQVGSESRMIVNMTRLRGDDAFRVFYMLHDPDPFRRKIARMNKEFDLADQIGAEEVNFEYLLSVALSEAHGDVKNEEIREIGEHGPYTVGGIPRQVFAVRGLPYNYQHDLFAGLRKAGVPFTVRVRWNPLSDSASGKKLGDMLGMKRFARREFDFLTAKVLVERTERNMGDGFGGIGMGTILIAINGIPYRDLKGKQHTGVEALLNGIREVRRWANDNNIDLDSLTAPMDQGNAHFAMIPGAWHLDPLEWLPIPHVALGRLLPIYSTCPVIPPNTAQPGYPILTLENAAYEIIERGLEVNEVGLGAVIGGTGFGKSYLFNTLMMNFLKNEGRILHEKVPLPVSVDTFEFGSGGEVGSSFNSMVRLLGGRVIQFGEHGISDPLNPWDVPIPLGPDGVPIGYGPRLLEILPLLMVTMAGGYKTDSGAGGPVTMEIEDAYRKAVVRIGGTLEKDLPGCVRSLRAVVGMIEHKVGRALLDPWVDSQQFGKYFPAAKDSTREQVVNYNFPLDMGPKMRAVLFSLAMGRISARAYDPRVHSKLILGDEIGAGLAKSADPKEEAQLESARTMLQKLYSNARRYGARVFMAAQRPDQILSMGPTLAGVVQNNCSTLFLGEIPDKEKAKELFRLTDGAYASLRELEPHQFAMIQQGLVTKVKIINPKLAHAASTTTKKEVILRDLIAASGRFTKMVPVGESNVEVPDPLAVARAMAACLDVASRPNPERTLDEFIREYQEIVNRRRAA